MMNRNKIFAMALVIFLVSSGLGITLGSTDHLQEKTSVDSDDTITKLPEPKLGYTAHDPIRIDNNSDMNQTAQDDGWGGNGSEGNPYIIEGYEIDGGGYGYAIYIGNTTDHFVVRDCYLHNASGNYDLPYFTNSGLHLYSVRNGIVDNNTASSNDVAGIYLDSSRDNTLSNNTASSNNDYGIYVYSSHENVFYNNTAKTNKNHGFLSYHSRYNTISNNTVSENRRGIYIYGGEENTLSNNTASFNKVNGIFLKSSPRSFLFNNNVVSNDFNGIYIYDVGYLKLTNNTISFNKRYGIRLDISSDNTLSNNTLIGNSIVIWGRQKHYWNTHTIDTSNTVNGKPIYYWKDRTDGTVPLGAGEVILANCEGVTVENQNVSDGSVGILLGFSDSNTICNTTISSNNVYGIYLDSSSDNTICNNTVSNNWIGVYLYSSDLISVEGNNLTENILSGILTEEASQISFFNNSISYGIDGIRLIYSENIMLYNNIIYSNDRDGIFLHLSHNNTVTKNSIYSNGRFGIFISNQADNELIENDIHNNMVGVSIGSSNRNLLMDNIIYLNDWSNVYLINSENNNIINNSMEDAGLTVYGTELTHWNTNNVSSNNTVNGKPIYYWNNVNSGTIPSDAGQVILANCQNVIVKDIVFADVSTGISLGFSDFNFIENNTVNSNSREGFYLYMSENNTIQDNNFSSNWIGSSLRGSHNNLIAENYISLNSEEGVLLTNSSNNEIYNNTISHNNADEPIPTGSFSKEVPIYQDYIYYISTFQPYFELLTTAQYVEYINVCNVSSFNISTADAGEAYDVDLGMFYDANRDGIPQVEEIVTYSGEADSNEYIEITSPENGVYILTVLGYNTANPGNIVLDINIMPNDEPAICSAGAVIKDSSENDIIGNTISYNNAGLLFNRSNYNTIYHNNFIDNSNQAYDDGDNRWNASYSTGGNYWSDYSGTDENSGPNQDQTGSDGIGDTPYTNIEGGSGAQDNYPLMEPWPGEESDTTPPVISSLSVTSITATSATVTWSTDEASDSRVNYSVNSDLTSNSTEYDPSLVTSHSITLTGLSPDTIHYFEVFSTDASGNRAKDDNSSNYYRFTTLAEDTNPPTITDLTLETPTTSDGFNFIANVTDDVGVAGVWINYRFDSGSPNNASMIKLDDNWTYELDVPSDATVLHYNYSARDVSNNWVATTDYTLDVLDNDAPSITDNSQTAGTTGDAFNFNALVTDNINVSAVHVEYWFGSDSSSSQNVSMTSSGGDTWDHQITLPANSTNSLHYVISAEDTSNNWVSIETVDISITDDDAPVADAGSDVTIDEGDTVTFDGSGSYDNVGISEYTWTFTENGTEIVLHGIDPSHTFNVSGNYTVTLTVGDEAGNEDSDTLVVNVKASASEDDEQDDEDPDDTEEDSDGDGIPDEWEEEHGLDPNDPSDADADDDGDGLTNKEEYEAGTDPNDPDTDGDGVPDGEDDDPLTPEEESGFPWWILVIIAAIVVVVLAIFFKKKKGEEEPEDMRDEFESYEEEEIEDEVI